MNDFLEFLYAHIPHRWLNKKAKGTKKLFKGLAKNVNYIYDFVTMIDRNNHTTKAEEILTDLENEYGIMVNPSYDLEFRRERILAKIRMQDSPITEKQLVSILEMMGFYDIKIIPLLGKFQINIQMQMPQECGYKAAEIQKMLHENLRAHIGIGTIYVLPTIETNVLVGAMVQQSMFVEILPYVETEQWESNIQVDTISKVYVATYADVLNDTPDYESKTDICAGSKIYVGAFIEIEEE